MSNIYKLSTGNIDFYVRVDHTNLLVVNNGVIVLHKYDIITEERVKTHELVVGDEFIESVFKLIDSHDT